ncbi:MAG TPA: effector-associated domain EAD1-containing protein [Thermoanaerobaculia bacterium]|jgi:hypothetical protein|nr:effector-associated domain EAD1-containing protein [Thermoanaerobaculia bacterium]
MPLSVQEFESNGLIGVVASIFNQENAAIGLLERIGFPRDLIPNFTAAGNPRNFWRSVAIEIEHGRTRGGLEALLGAVADDYPYNPELAPYRAAESKPGERHTGGATVVIIGDYDLHWLIDRARNLAAARGWGAVELGIITGPTCQLHLPEATPEAAYELTEELRREGLTARTSVASSRFRDYLLESLRVEAQDTGRFELNAVPASTRVQEVARAVMSQYKQGDRWPHDKAGHARPAVVDKQEDDGSTHRLDPAATLHESGIEDGSTLHVAPESTAGINPRIRDEALARVRAQVMAYADALADFEVEANAVHAPTEYLLRFEAPGWGPPAEPGGQPRPVDVHEVLLVMPDEFPMAAPGAYWQTPVFHPNIDRDSGTVCLGELADRYRPALDFGPLCQMLVDIARYWNYEITEGYDQEARDWAVSPEGQIAIERRGGRSVLRRLLTRFQTETGEPPPLRIRRLDE